MNPWYHVGVPGKGIWWLGTAKKDCRAGRQISARRDSNETIYGYRMSCAACSARVEKAVSKVPGVTACSVSLLTNSMGVEGTASQADIIKAVVDAGYGASVKGEETAAASVSYQAEEEALADHETPVLKKRLLASLGFLMVLMYFSMGHMMWGWPVPGVF